MRDYKDRSLTARERARLLLKELTLDEKMGQLNCFMPYRHSDEERMEEMYPDGVGQISTLVFRELDTMEEALDFQRRIQEKVMDLSPHRIPAIFHMEGLCGAFLPGAVSFPSGIARGASFDPALEREIGAVVGKQERAVGITETLAPVLDVSRDSRMGRQGEPYGEDPTLVAAMGTSYTKGLQGEATGALRTEAVAKHFLGFHTSNGGIHGADSPLSERELREIFAKPFQAAITEAGLKGIMPCYCSIAGEPVSASHKFLTELLRKEMGFEGIAVSDYGAIHNIHHVQKVCESQTEAGLRSMKAGMDMELPGMAGFNGELKEWFASGRADMAVLDQAVERVLTVKFRMGLFEQPFGLPREQVDEIYRDPRGKELSKRSAQESFVLLKNDGVLPLSRKIKKLAVIGWHASTARSFYGGYTHFTMRESTLAAVSTLGGLEDGSEEELKKVQTIPGTQIQADSQKYEEILKLQNPQVKSLLEELSERMPDTKIVYAYGYPFAGNDMSHHEEALEAARDADVVLLTLGGKYGTCSMASMGEGVDAADINLPECQEVFIQKLSELHKPAVGIHFNGRPISSDAADEYLNAILEAWNPSEMGAEAIVETLLGEYNPGGKMPVSTARTSGQIPIYYNHANGSAYHQGESIGFANYVDMSHTPRYFFGHGLSYTTFTYRDLTLAKKEVMPAGEFRVSVEIENSGSRKGDEVVQLYLRDRYASMTRPVMELAGFYRVTLEPGEKKRLIFTLRLSQLAFLDSDMHWKVEKGEIDVMAGSSCADIRLTDTFRITEDAFVDGRTRGFYGTAVEEIIK